MVLLSGAGAQSFYLYSNMQVPEKVRAFPPCKFCAVFGTSATAEGNEEGRCRRISRPCLRSRG